MQELSESQREECAILIMPSESPLMRGHGTVDYTCPTCRITIFQAVTPRYYSGLAVKCGGCLSISVVPRCPSVML